jgi:hypothetical protein
MNQDILLSKIVPNSTDTAWAQAYTTLNVYITLSIERVEGKTSVATYGKELLEKLQREFFALDEKNLDNIKKAVGNVSTTIEEGYLYSILVGAIVGDILYIVIASEGQVIIKRGSKTGSIATGVENELHGFSGKLKHDDIVIIETGDFNKKLPIDSLTEHLNASDVLQIAENITPIIHGASKGTESAIILQFKNLTGIPESSRPDFESSDEDVDEPQAEKPAHDYAKENLWTKEIKENDGIEDIANENDSDREYPQENSRRKLPSFSIPKINFASKKIIIIAVVILLVGVLVGGIALQTKKADDTKRVGEFTKIYNPAKSRFDEGVNLEPLNKTLALEEFTAASTLVKDALSKFPEGTDEHKKLLDLQSQIDAKVSEIGGGGSAKNIKELFKPSGDIKSIDAITAKGGSLLILDSSGKQVVVISDKGAAGKSYDIKSSDTFISADDKFIYTMGKTATSIDRGNGKVTQIAKSIKGSSFDIFGSNLYTLDGKDVLKYRAPAYDSSSYFTETPSFKSDPVDMAISGPVWILEENGTIERFTKGKKDDLVLSGLTAPVGEGAKIYADSDLTNVYILDVKNQRVVVVSDDGDFITQYEGSFIKGATSFAIDEEKKIGYVLKSNTVYSFDL